MKKLVQILSLALLGACGGPAPAPVDADVADTGLADEDAGPGDTGPPDAGLVRVTADTQSGPVIGVDRGGLLVFRGIPYAAPPTAERRFAAPEPVEPWSTPVDATGPGTSCFQGGDGSFSGSEDCLHVNVWTPSLTGARAVMVFIHGGAFTSFSASEPAFEPAHLAEDGDVVVVSINYRLDELGWLAHPSLGGSGETTGNWGFLDQQAALRWVRENAAHFGGDPTNVTVFGESAGAMSVGLHLIAAGSETLFERAMAHSGPAVWTIRTRAEAEARGAVVAESLGCSGDVAACLRGASAESLLDAVPDPHEVGGLINQTGGILTRPTLDGVVFDAQPLAAFRAGATRDVPIVYGTNTDEGSVFHGAVFGTRVPDEAAYRAALGRLDFLGIDASHVDAIVARYPVASYPSANDALTQVTTDGGFTCATRYTTELLAATGRNVRLYRFDQAPARVAIRGLGAYHAAELLFLFGTSHPLLGNSSSAPELGPAMRGYWSRFASTGDPRGTPAWPVWSPTSDQRLHLSAVIDIETGYLDAVCDFWDTIYDTL